MAPSSSKPIQAASKPPPRNAPVWEWRRWRAASKATTPAAPPTSPPPLPLPPPSSSSWAVELSPPPPTPSPPPPLPPASPLVLDADVHACHLCHLVVAAIYMVLAIVGAVRLRRYFQTVRRSYAAVHKSEELPPEQAQSASSLRDGVLGVWHSRRGYSRQGSGPFSLDKVPEDKGDGSCSPEFISEGSPGWVALAPGRSLSCGGEEVFTDPPPSGAGPSS